MFKKSFYSFLLAVLLISVTSVASFAQDSSISNVSRVKLRNANPILEDGEVRGYYIFYRVEKKDRKTIGYKIQFFNENLEKTGSKSITGTPYLSLIEASYNGTNVMLKFLDTKERKYTFRQYDRLGELASRKSKEYDRRDAMASAGYNAGDNTIFPVNGRGFLNLSGKKFKKAGYEITFYPNTKAERGWTFKSDPEEKRGQYAYVLGANEDIVLVSIASMEGITLKGLKNYVLGIDMKTGKKIFEKPMSKNEENVLVNSGFIDNEAKEFTVFGTYFGESGDAYKKNGEGLYSVSFDFSGNLINEKINLWQEDFGKLLPVDKKGKMTDLGYFYLHDIFKTDDGRIFAFGEQYRKAVSAGGVALKMLASASRNISTNVSAVKVVVEDMLFFEFDSKFELKKVEFFDKQKSNFSLPEGYATVKAFKLGRIVDQYGGFDYFYKIENKEENSVSIIYRDWNREEKKSEIHSVTYAGGDFVTKMVPIETDAKRYGLLQGKEGHIVVLEYFKKEKKLKLRMEKINF